MAENLRAHVVHGLLADTLHDANLNVLSYEIENKNEQVDDTDNFNAEPGAIFRECAVQSGREIAIDGNLKNFGRREFKRGDDSDKRESQENAPAIRMQILHQAAH